MTPGGAIVVLESVAHRYGTVVAVDGVSLEIGRGEMFGLIGPDGAGKTTALRMTLGLLAVHAGRVRTCGLDPRKERRRLSGRVGYLSQRFSLYGDLTVDENVAFFAEIHGVAGGQGRRDQLLDLVRLTPFRGRLADKLSGGMRQKLALACTLVHTPELLVLDEPTTGVDPVSRRDFWRLLASLQRDGLTVLLTTPYLDEAERCSRVALMERGRLLVTAAPDALRASAGAALEVLARPYREAAAWLGRQPEIEDVEAFGERLHAGLAEHARDEATVALLAAGLRAAGLEVESVRLTTASLEDVFIQQIRAAEAAPAGGRP
ncbi:MAG TPA: ABC transporter ATP-binding protein [Vicinamibacteria bacterium]|nr:ABC transporter ATP-binding protein [Vicinamibacteria bacterium]